MIFAHPRGVPGALNCLQVGRVLHRHLDGDLDARTTEMLLAHLEECRRCGLRVEEYEHLVAALSTRGVDADAAARLRRFAASLTSHHHD